MIKIEPNKQVTDFLDTVISNFKPANKTDFGSLKELDTSVDVPWNRDGCYYVIPFQIDKDLCQTILPDKQFLIQTGKFYYPPGGFMGWHTNSNAEGYRVYMTYCKESNKSFFRYLDGEIKTDWEQAGWNCRLFEVRKDKLYWHCVWSDTDRYSFGFRFAF